MVVGLVRVVMRVVVGVVMMSSRYLPWYQHQQCYRRPCNNSHNNSNYNHSSNHSSNYHSSNSNNKHNNHSNNNHNMRTQSHVLIWMW